MPLLWQRSSSSGAVDVDDEDDHIPSLPARKALYTICTVGILGTFKRDLFSIGF